VHGEDAPEAEKIAYYGRCSIFWANREDSDLSESVAKQVSGLAMNEIGKFAIGGT
jgi:hypothetical protein